MSYDNATILNHSYNAQDIGNGTITKKIRPPRGATRGRVESIHLLASETFNQVTTQAYIRVGVASDLDKFAELAIGALASGATLSESDAATLASVLTDDGQFDLSQETEDELTVTMVAPTGGTPAGIADVDLSIAWFY